MIDVIPIHLGSPDREGCFTSGRVATPGHRLVSCRKRTEPASKRKATGCPYRAARAGKGLLRCSRLSVSGNQANSQDLTRVSSSPRGATTTAVRDISLARSKDSSRSPGTVSVT